MFDTSPKFLIFVLSASLTFLTLSSSSYAQPYTADEFRSFIDRLNLSYQENSLTDCSITEDFDPPNELRDEESRASYNDVLQRFASPGNLVEFVVAAWATSEGNADRVIEINKCSDGTDFYFDEGLWIKFDHLGALISMNHWPHYSFGAGEGYKEIFDGIPGFARSDRHAFYFQAHALIM